MVCFQNPITACQVAWGPLHIPFNSQEHDFGLKAFEKQTSFRYLALTKDTPLASLSTVAIYPSVYKSALLKSEVLLSQVHPTCLRLHIEDQDYNMQTLSTMKFLRQASMALQIDLGRAIAIIWEKKRVSYGTLACMQELIPVD